MVLSWLGVCCRSAGVLLYGMRPIGVTSSTSNVVSSRTRVLLYKHYSSSKARLGQGRRALSRLEWVNEKYESFLQRRFPRFYILYHTFMKGFRHLFQDGKEIRLIKTKMIRHNVPFQQLPYREMEKLRQFRRDIIKATPLVLISIPPFANYLVFVLMYFFPRQLLMRHFWTPQQQVEFQGVYHAYRAQNHGAILMRLARAVPDIKDQRLQSHLLDLCEKVQTGKHPCISEIQAVRSLFSGPPLGMKRLDVTHLRLLCSLLFLTPRLPGMIIGRRLSNHTLELLQLDRALNVLGPQHLSEAELRQACYLRGLNSGSLSASQCCDWLSQWLQLSTRLKESEASLLLHCMVLLSTNYPKTSRS